MATLRQLIDGRTRYFGLWKVLHGSGTTEGAVKGWDTRGRGRKQQAEPFHEAFRHYREGSESRRVAAVLQDGQWHPVNDVERSPGGTRRVDWTNMRITAHRHGMDVERQRGRVRFVQLTPENQARLVRQDNEVLARYRTPQSQPTTPATATSYSTMEDVLGRPSPPPRPTWSGNPADRKPVGYLAKTDIAPLATVRNVGINIASSQYEDFKKDFQMSPKDLEDLILNGLPQDATRDARMDISSTSPHMWYVTTRTNAFNQTRSFDLNQIR